jgi:hypothetical protein
MPSASIVRLLISVLLVMGKAAFAEDYVFIGVSGGLQDGFPDHVKLDYHSGQDDEVRAVFVGRALVRGTKAYLDVMQEGWRQYTLEPGQPLINSVVVVSGCHEHANQYWIYAVDSRQVLAVLNNEPRFLSITPDTGLVDLTVAETDKAVKVLAQSQIQKQGKRNTTHVSFPIVVATWYHESFLPSPPMRHLPDGTAITNFPASLALWAKVNDADRVTGCDYTPTDSSSSIGSNNTVEECEASSRTLAAQRRYWDGIRSAVRAAEADRPSRDVWRANGPPFACERLARLGVDADTARINYSFSAEELHSVFRDTEYRLDLNQAVLTVMH